MELSVSYEYSGYSDYWGGNGRRWDNDAGCAFAYYSTDTTLADLVDQWCDDFCMGDDFDAFPAEIDSDDVRAAILADFLNDKGRADYKSDALCEWSEQFAADNGLEAGVALEDQDIRNESPVVIILIECKETEGIEV